MDIPVLYEDKNVVVVNKPAGLVVHPDGRTKEATLVDWILEKYPEIKEVGEHLTLSSGEIIFRPGIVHRLDRETSGVLIVAKNQESYLDLKNQFQERTTHKHYNAFVWGNVTDDEGVIDRPIGRSRKDFRQWSAQRFAKGDIRDAVTNYKVLERNGQFCFLDLEPKTGRTHQIRVHLKAINHPIVADKLYAPKRKPALGFERLALHARSLEFRSLDGKEMKVEAPLPADFVSALTKLDLT